MPLCSNRGSMMLGIGHNLWSNIRSCVKVTRLFHLSETQVAIIKIGMFLYILSGADSPALLAPALLLTHCLGFLWPISKMRSQSRQSPRSSSLKSILDSLVSCGSLTISNKGHNRTTTPFNLIKSNKMIWF